MTGKIETNATPGLHQMGGKLTEYTARATFKAIESVRSSNKVEDIYLAACGVVGAMHVLASLVGREQSDHDQYWQRVNAESCKFAGLLAAFIAPSVGPAGEVNVEFGPHMLGHALLALEKILGYQPDQHLDEVMCQQVREFMVDEGAQEELARLKAESEARLATAQRATSVPTVPRSSSKNLH